MMGIVNLVIVLTIILLIFMLVARVQVLLRPRRNKRRQVGVPADAAGLRDMVARGKIDEAVHVYRQFTGTDQFTAREAVAAIQREQRLDAVRSDVDRRLRLGDKAGAIEAYQQATDADLAEALAAIESWPDRS